MADGASPLTIDCVYHQTEMISNFLEKMWLAFTSVDTKTKRLFILLHRHESSFADIRHVIEVVVRGSLHKVVDQER